MKLFTSLRGPRLGTKLALLGLALLIVPWFSYRQLVEMEQLLIQGQSQAQLLTAEGISTLFNGRQDLFNDLPVDIEDFEPLFAHQLTNPIRLDGLTDDWGADLLKQRLAFTSTHPSGDGSFELLLGERADQLYAHMRIKDDQLVPRDPDYLRLDNADHIRLEFIQPNAEDGRLALILEDESAVTGFAMDEQWRFAATGNPDSRIQGFAVAQVNGYVNIEFRVPLALLGSRRFFGISWVDVDDPVSRGIVRTTGRCPLVVSVALILSYCAHQKCVISFRGSGTPVHGFSSSTVSAECGQRRVRFPVATRLLTILAGMAESPRHLKWSAHGFTGPSWVKATRQKTQLEGPESGC